MKPKVSWRKKIKKIRDEITEMENRKTIEEISKIKTGPLRRSIKLKNCSLNWSGKNQNKTKQKTPVSEMKEMTTLQIIQVLK